MFLSRKRLRQIIQEEFQKVLEDLPATVTQKELPGPDYDDEGELPPLTIPPPE